MGPLRRLLALSVCFIFLADVTLGRGATFTHVRYNGGALATEVEANDWHNKLTVAADSIVLRLKDKQSLTILPKQISSLSYGEEALRRVGPTIGLNLASFHISRLFRYYRPHQPHFHFIGINYTDSKGHLQGLLLQGDNENFQEMIAALNRVTGIPVIVAESERHKIPAGVAVQAVNEHAHSEKT